LNFLQNKYSKGKLFVKLYGSILPLQFVSLASLEAITELVSLELPVNDKGDDQLTKKAMFAHHYNYYYYC